MDEQTAIGDAYSSYSKDELINALERTSDRDEIERIKSALLDRYRVELKDKHKLKFSEPILTAQQESGIFRKMMTAFKKPK